jgi:hypothetical protein
MLLNATTLIRSQFLRNGKRGREGGGEALFSEMATRAEASAASKWIALANVEARVGSELERLMSRSNTSLPDTSAAEIGADMSRFPSAAQLASRSSIAKGAKSHLANIG